MFLIQAADELPGDRGETSDFWYQAIPGAAGGRVTPDSALALPAVYAATRIITDAIMQIPLILYRRTDGDGKERATDHPLYSLLHDDPNETQTAPEWREVMQHHLLLRGNGYSEIALSGSGIGELSMPLHPDRVKPELMTTPGGAKRIRYRIRETDGTERIVPDTAMLHLRGLGLEDDGVSGLSVIALERKALSVGLSAQDFTERFIQNDARPSGWIEHPGHFKDDEQRTKFRSSWQAAQTGANRGKTAVLEHGLKYHPLDMKLVDAQFLETRKYTNLDVARMFRVPPHMLGELDRATFSNIAQQGVEFVKYTMLSWLVRWEKRLSKQLLNQDERREYFFEFLVDGLERGDGETRSRYYKNGIQDGWLTRNEVRRRENLNPIDGLDEPLEPMNMRNPGGENDERLEAMKQSAAQACATKLAHSLIKADAADRVDLVASSTRLIADFMHCGEDRAAAAAAFGVELLEADAPIEAWRARFADHLAGET